MIATHCFFCCAIVFDSIDIYILVHDIEKRYISLKNLVKLTVFFENNEAKCKFF